MTMSEARFAEKPEARFAELAIRGHPVQVTAETPPASRDTASVTTKPARRKGSDELVLARSGRMHAWLRKRNGVSVEVGVVLPDRLPGGEVEAVRAWAARTAAPTPGIGRRRRASGLVVLNQHRFLDDRFYRIGYARLGRVIGFDIPPTLSPLAAHVEAGTGGSSGAVLLGMLGRTRTLPSRRKRWRSYAGRPPVSIEDRGEVGHRIVFTSTAPAKAAYDVDGSQWKGRFDDCATLTYVVTGEALDLGDTCRAAGVLVPEPTVGEVGIVAEAADALARVVTIDRLHSALLVKLHQHKGLGEIEPSWLMSPAGLATAYLKAAGIGRAPEVEPYWSGVAASAFYAGRLEARVVHCETPVVSIDGAQMYPNVAEKLGLVRYQAAERLVAEEGDPEEFAEFLSSPGLFERLCDSDQWDRRGLTFVEIEAEDDVVIHRGFLRDGSAVPMTTTAPLTYDGTLWWPWCDAAADKLATGPVPKVRRIIRFRPEGCQATTAVPLPGGAGFLDFREGAPNPYLTLMRLRRTHEAAGDQAAAGSLKRLNNSLAYGLTARLDQHPGRHFVDVWHGREDPLRTEAPIESLGPHTCWPLAATETAGARLLLCMVEHQAETILRERHCVESMAGVLVAADTDGVHLLATQEGGLVDLGDMPAWALSFAEVQEIVNAFAWAAPPGERSLFKVEHDGLGEQVFGHYVQSKRYALYRRGPTGEVELLKCSEHIIGGSVLDPSGNGEARGPTGARAWIEDIWRYLIDPEHHPLPAWGDRRAVCDLVVSNAEVSKRFGGFEQVQPWTRWIVPVTRNLLGTPSVVAPFDDCPESWDEARWQDPKSGRRLSLGRWADLESGGGSGAVIAMSVSELVADYGRGKPDPRYVPLVGSPRFPRGILVPVPTVSAPAATTIIGKEAGKYAAALAGEIETSDARMVHRYGQVSDSWGLVVQAFGFLPQAEIATEARVSTSQLRELAHERSRPRSSTAERVTRAVVRRAVQELHGWGQRDKELLLPGERSLPVLVAFVTEAQARQNVRCAAGNECRHAIDGLGAVLDKRHRRWCGPSCKEVVRRRGRGIPGRRTNEDRLRPSRRQRHRLPTASDVDPGALAGLRSCPHCGCIFAGAAGKDGHCDCGHDFEVVAT